LVRRDIDPTSARCSLVTVTRAGRQQLDAARRDHTDHMSCRLAKLAPEHQRALADALPALEALVEAVLPGEDAGHREIERWRRARRTPRQEITSSGKVLPVQPKARRARG
jgi:DNA-binding MarR family transcriptional regulator